MNFFDRFKKDKERIVGKKAAVVSDKKREERLEAGAVVVKKDKAVVKPSKKAVPSALAKVLLRPVVTEKSAIIASLGQYVFKIDRRANRLQVAAAVKAVYGVVPTKVRIQNLRGEPVRFSRRFGKRSAWKKAIVCLPKGKTINVHEGV